jgi:hypothetical protein
VDRARAARLQRALRARLDHPPATEGRRCAPHPARPPRVHGKPVLRQESVDYRAPARTCVSLHLFFIRVEKSGVYVLP